MSDGRKTSKASASSSSGRSTRARTNEENAQASKDTQGTVTPDLGIPADTTVDADTDVEVEGDPEDATPLDNGPLLASTEGAEEAAEDEESVAKEAEQPVVTPDQDGAETSELPIETLNRGNANNYHVGDIIMVPRLVPFLEPGASTSSTTAPVTNEPDASQIGKYQVASVPAIVAVKFKTNSVALPILDAHSKNNRTDDQKEYDGMCLDVVGQDDGTLQEGHEDYDSPKLVVESTNAAEESGDPRAWYPSAGAYVHFGTPLFVEHFWPKRVETRLTNLSRRLLEDRYAFTHGQYMKPAGSPTSKKSRATKTPETRLAEHTKTEKDNYMQSTRDGVNEHLNVADDEDGSNAGQVESEPKDNDGGNNGEVAVNGRESGDGDDSGKKTVRPNPIKTVPGAGRPQAGKSDNKSNKRSRDDLDDTDSAPPPKKPKANTGKDSNRAPKPPQKPAPASAKDDADDDVDQGPKRLDKGGKGPIPSTTSLSWTQKVKVNGEIRWSCRHPCDPKYDEATCNHKCCKFGNAKKPGGQPQVVNDETEEYTVAGDSKADSKSAASSITKNTSSNTKGTREKPPKAPPKTKPGVATRIPKTKKPPRKPSEERFINDDGEKGEESSKDDGDNSESSPQTSPETRRKRKIEADFRKEFGGKESSSDPEMPSTVPPKFKPGRKTASNTTDTGKKKAEPKAPTKTAKTTSTGSGDAARASSRGSTDTQTSGAQGGNAGSRASATGPSDRDPRNKAFTDTYGDPRRADPRQTKKSGTRKRSRDDGSAADEDKPRKKKSR